jgi:hypothetical protein
MESLLSTTRITPKIGDSELTAERVIHAAVFALLLVGLWTISGWITYHYVDDLVLQIAGIALSWGIILLVMYVGFKRAKWTWWSSQTQENF